MSEFIYVFHFRLDIINVVRSSYICSLKHWHPNQLIVVGFGKCTEVRRLGLQIKLANHLQQKWAHYPMISLTNGNL